MALATRITEQEAFAAIESIVLRGDNPTHQLVRTELGDRGSNPVISRFISGWFGRYGAKLHASAVRAKANEPVAALSEQIITASRQAAQQVGEEERRRKQVLDDREAMLNGREESLLSLERKQDEREIAHAEWIRSLQEQVAVSKATAIEAGQRAVQAEQALALAQRAMEVMEKEHRSMMSGQLDRMEEMLGTLEERTKELRAAQAQLASVTAAHQADLARLQDLRATREALEARLNQARADGLAAADAHAQALQRLQEQVAAGAVFSVEVDRRAQEFRRELDRQLARLSSSVTAAKELQSELDQVRMELADRTRVLADVSARHEADVEHIATLTSQLAVANQRIEKQPGNGAKHET